MTFYRVDWYEEGGDEGWSRSFFDSKVAAVRWARRRARKAAEDSGDSREFAVHRVVVAGPFTRAKIQGLMEGGGFEDERLEGFEYERKCARCDHETSHAEADEGDACSACFHSRSVANSDICRRPLWRIRRVVKRGS